MSPDIIQNKIFTIRGEKVMLDFDLAALYGVITKRLNEQVKRNKQRFPNDFMFQLNTSEWNLILNSPQFYESPMRSHNATASIKKRNLQSLPFVFTEHGAVMLASVLKSEQAIQANLLIVRAFIAIRQVSIQYKELAEKLAGLETTNNKQFREIYQALNYLIDQKQQEELFSKRERIGFIK